MYVCLGFFKSSWFSSHRFHSEKTYFSGWRLISFHPAVSASTGTREKQKKGKEATDGSERIEGSLFVWRFHFCVFLHLEQGRILFWWAAWPITVRPRQCHPFVPCVPGSRASTITQISSEETQGTIFSHAEVLTARGIVWIYLLRCVPIKKATTRKKVTKIASF